MTKKHFIALADAIREHNQILKSAHASQLDVASDVKYLTGRFNTAHLETLAAFCHSQNSAFKRDRWLGYIAGTNGKNGGKVGA